MIHPVTLKILRLWARICCTLKIIPLDYDPKTNIPIHTNWFGIGHWYFVNLVMISTSTFLVINLRKAVQAGDDVWNILIHVVILISSFLAPLCEISIAKSRVALPYFWKCYFEFTVFIHERYMVPGYPRLDKKSDILVKLIAGSCILIPVDMIVIYAYNPLHSAFTPTIFLNRDAEIDTLGEWLIIIMCGIFTFWYTCLIVNSAVFICLVATFVSVTDFLSRESRPNQKSKLTRDILRQPATAIFIYRCFQIFVKIGNEIVKDVSLYIMNILLYLAILSFCAWVRFRAVIPLSALIFSAMTSILCIAIVSLAHLGLGKVYDGSKAWVSAWKRYGQFMRPRDRRLMMKYLKSCQLNRFKIGSVGYFHKQAIGKQVIARFSYYANKMLLFLR